MEWWQAIVLGLIQGLAEFLPVSSSGHLAIGRELLGVELSGDLVFEVVVHAATVLSTIVVFRKQIWKLLRGLLRFFQKTVPSVSGASPSPSQGLVSDGPASADDTYKAESGGALSPRRFIYNDETDYVLKIIVSMIPVFVVGVFFKDCVEELFSSLAVVGAALLLTALLLFFSDAASKDKSGKPSFCANGIGFRQAFIIGLGQALAVVPGLSRSGTTISTGLLCGVRREVVAQFSFLMVLVPVLGEAFLDVVGGDFASSSTGALSLSLGFISAFISGLFACKVMIALVKRARLKWFALYCALVGVAVLALTCL